MLPKLQQSSLAQSLRKDNLTSLIQCRSIFMKARTNSNTLSPGPIINLINHGRISMLRKILKAPSETSLPNMFPNKESKPNKFNLNINNPFQAH